MWIKSPALTLFVVKINKDEIIERKTETTVLRVKSRGIQKALCHVHVYKNSKKENGKLSREVGWQNRVWEHVQAGLLIPDFVFPASSPANLWTCLAGVLVLI